MLSGRVVKLDSFLGAYTLAIGVFDRSHFGDDALIADVRDCSCGVCVCWARRTGTPKNNHAMPASEEHTLHIKTPACTEKTGAQRHGSWRSDLPRGRLSGNSRQGRSPGSGIILLTAPSQTSQWHVRLSSPLTVAGQQGSYTPFPLHPLTRDPTGVTNRLNIRMYELSSWDLVKRQAL